MHRVDGGWHAVGQVALDDPDLSGALARLKSAAQHLDDAPFATKLLIPNDQIKYLALDTTRADDAQVRAALDGATPYAVDDLVYDFAKGGGRTYVAAVARETLDEAQAFATEHGFNPVSFAAVPEPFTYVGEAGFGAVAGQTVEPDTEAVVVIGTADVQISDVAPTGGQAAVETAPPPEPAAEPETAQVEAAQIETAQIETAQIETAPVENQADTQASNLVSDAPEDLPQQGTFDAVFTDVPDAPPALEPAQEPTLDLETAPDITPETGPEFGPETDPETVPQPDEVSVAPPMFASRANADRNNLANVPPVTTPAPQTTPAPTQRTAHDDEHHTGQHFETTNARTEPTLTGADDPASTAAPTVAPSVAPPAPSLPRDDLSAPPVAAPDPTAATPPLNGTAPSVTGTSDVTVPPDAAAASLRPSRDIDIDTASSTATDGNDGPAASADTPAGTAAAAGAAALSAASAVTGAVGGAVGGMFASRRMARADQGVAADQAEQTPKADETSRLTVFGARKKPAPKKKVIGGKPRFLGLILTAVLLFFLLAVAALAALSSDRVARWFGLGNTDTQIATQDTSTPLPQDVATVQPTPAETDPQGTDTVQDIAQTAASGAAIGDVLSPEEAQRIYAATGVWQRAPRIAQVPRITSIDNMTLAAAQPPVPRVPASPLTDPNSVAGDAVIATPVDPPPPTATFNFGPDGRVIATPEGSITPDGILIFTGAPPLNPPTRPGTIAPEITPQDQLAAVVPDTATELPDAPDGVIIISGPPAILPPIRPGTSAPVAAPLVAPDAVTQAATDQNAEAQTEGVNLISGPPPVLPPVRPDTVAPQQDDATLTGPAEDGAIELATATAQTPDVDTPRPQPRPAAIVDAAVQRATTPVLGTLTIAQAAAFRPQTRPAGLAPEPQSEPEPEAAPEPEVIAAATQPGGLQLAPEIAAAVQAAASRPNTIINPTAQAVASSGRPDTRPRNMARIVERAQAASARAAQQVAARAPRTIQPSGPTGSAVAQNATLDNAINLRDLNLIGIYGGSGDRRALVRLSNGRYQRVTVGDRLDGGRVTAISAARLSYEKRGRSITLEVPG